MQSEERATEQARQHRDQRRARVSRVRWWLRRLPRKSSVHRYPVIRWFAAAARRRPYLWSFELAGVRRAIYAGAIVAFLPIFGLQLLVAFVAALLVRANLAVTCGLQLLTNPLTAGPFYYTTYRIGIWIIRTLDLGEGRTPLGTRFNALVLGGVVVGLALALVLDLALRISIWEAGVLRARHQRARDDASRRAEQSAADIVPGGSPAGTSDTAGSPNAKAADLHAPSSDRDTDAHRPANRRPR